MTKRYYFKQSLYVLLCSVQLINGTPKKYGNFDVDEFLKKVIVSEKFDEMAEKIADKAVEKFQKMQNNEKAKLGAKEAAYRVFELDAVELNNNTNVKITKEQSKVSEGNEKVETTTDEAVNIPIDTDAFKKKEPYFLKDLSLKYNKFTKGVNKPKSKEETDYPLYDLEDTTLNKPKLSQETNTFTTKTQDLNNNSDDKDLDDAEVHIESITKSKENFNIDIKRDFNTAHSKKNKNKHEPEKDLDSSDKENRKISKETSESHSLEANQDTKISKEFSVDVTFEKNSSNNEDDEDTRVQDEELKRHKTRRPSYKSMLAKRNEIDNKKIKNKIVKKDKPVSDESKVDKKEIEQKTEELSNEREKYEDKSPFYKRAESLVVRREGNKFYTHERHPDYDEYHELLAIKRQLLNSKRKRNDLKSRN